MVTRFELGPYAIEADVERTRAYYRDAPPMDGGCGCQGCRNYDLWSRTAVPGAVRDWFDALGVELNKPARTHVYYPKADGTLFYGGFYHVCGAMLNELERRGGPFIHIDADYDVSLTSECDLLEDDFPRPCFQVEIEFTLPWLLDEPCEY